MAWKPPWLEKGITEYDLNGPKAKEGHCRFRFALFLELHYFTEELGLTKKQKGNLDCKKCILLLSKDTEIVRHFP